MTYQDCRCTDTRKNLGPTSTEGCKVKASARISAKPFEHLQAAALLNHVSQMKTYKGTNMLDGRDKASIYLSVKRVKENTKNIKG